jgi:hypothetical protein
LEPLLYTTVTSTEINIQAVRRSWENSYIYTTDVFTVRYDILIWANKEVITWRRFHVLTPGIARA